MPLGKKLVSYRTLRSKKGIDFDRRTLERLEASGKFPKRIRMSERSFYYVDDEIDAYIANLIKARDVAASNN